MESLTGGRRVLSLVALVLALLACASARAQVVTSIDNFDNRTTVAPWTFANGAEYPGASGSIALATGYLSTRALALNYNFDCVTTAKGKSCGQYVATTLAFPLPGLSGAGIRFMTRSAPNVQLMVRIVDKSGQTLQFRAVRQMEGYDANIWYQVTIAFDKPESYWGGANNGVVQNPVKSISILASSPATYPLAGKLTLDSIAMLASVPPVSPLGPTNGVTAIDNFENRAIVAPWKFWAAADSGATGSIGSVAGHGSSRALALNYNFQCITVSSGNHCGQSVAAILALPRPALSGAAISFMAKSTPDIQLVVSVIDQSGQSLNYQTSRQLEARDPASWYQVTIPLNKPSSYWGGANNGTVQSQIKSIWISASGPRDFPVAGTVSVDDIAVLSSLDTQYVLQPTAAVIPAPSGAASLAPRIGVAYHPWNARIAALDVAHAAGISFVRTDLMWNWIETNGVYNFSSPDLLVAALEARGMGAIFIIHYAHSAHNVKTAEGVAAYGRFAEAAARRYAGRKVRFELGNEPDNAGSWGQSANPAQEYAALCKEGVAAVHRGNPAAAVSTGGLSWFAFDYLKQLLAADAAEGANAIGIHGYRSGGPESLVDSLLVANWWIQRITGKNIPVWNTEWGYSLGAAPGDGHSASFRQGQAVLAARQMLSQWALNMPVAVWYDLIDDGTDANHNEQNFGLLDFNLNEKPAMQALRTLTSQASGRAYKGLVKDAPPGLHIMKLEGSNDLVFIAWNSLPNTSADLRLPIPGLLSTANYLGTPVSGVLQSGPTSYWSFQLDQADGPIYIRYAKP
jgi:hypothetical protein